MRGFGREKIKNNGLYLHATFTSHKTLYVIMKEETQTEIIEKTLQLLKGLTHAEAEEIIWKLHYRLKEVSVLI